MRPRACRRSRAAASLALAALALCACESSGGGVDDGNAFRPSGSESMTPTYMDEMRSTLDGRKAAVHEMMDGALLGQQARQATGQAVDAAAGGFFDALTSWFR